MLKYNLCKEYSQPKIILFLSSKLNYVPEVEFVSIIVLNLFILQGIEDRKRSLAYLSSKFLQHLGLGAQKSVQVAELSVIEPSPATFPG